MHHIHRCRVAGLAFVVTTAVVGLAVLPIRVFAADPPDRITRMTAEGAQPRTGTFSLLPFERIDMVSGNGVLTFTDLSLPGNAGFDLQIQRVLNLNTRTWRTGVPGPEMIVLPQEGK